MGRQGRLLFESLLADAGIVLTLIALEGVLSFDNAAILAALTRKLPPEQRRKALLYGLAGAYVFRTLAIFGALFILRNPVLKALGGGYLIFLTLKHFLQLHAERNASPEEAEKARTPVGFLGLSAFWSTVVLVELADIAFALDQILVAVAFTDRIALILIAAFSAILMLRVAAAVLTRVMDWFPALESIAYFVVGLVGVKLVASWYFGDEAVEHAVPKALSAAITLSIFLVPVVVKLVYDRWFGGSPRTSKH